MRIRGGSSALFIYPKKCYAVKLTKENGEDLDANMLGIRKENSWILDAMSNDRLRMRNRLLFDVWNEMNKLPYETEYNNRNGTKGCYVELFVNGSYNGLYCFSDKIDRKLLGIKKPKIEGNSVEIRGLLYKGVRWDDASYTLSRYDEEPMDTTSWNAWELKVPEDFPSPDTWNPLKELIDFCGGDEENFLRNYQDYFYVDNLIDYMLFCYIFNIYDMPYKNTYLSVVNINKGKRFLITPWDLDGSLGMDWNGFYNNEASFYYNQYEPNDSLKYTYMSKFQKLMPFKVLFYKNVDGFRDKFIKRFEDLRNGMLSVESIENRIRNYQKSFVESGAWTREFGKWEKGYWVNLGEDMETDIQYAIQWYSLNLQIIEEWIKTATGINRNSNNTHYTHTNATLHLSGRPNKSENMLYGIVLYVDEKGKWNKKVVRK